MRAWSREKASTREGAGQRTGVGEQEPAVDGQRPAGAHPPGDGAQPRDGLGGLRRREQRRGPRQQHRRPAPVPRAPVPGSPVSAAGDLRERVAVDVDLTAADLLEEPGDGGRVRGRDAVAAQLHGPERAEVAVALVGQRVVQRRGAVVDLGVQLRRGCRRGVEPVALGEEADQGVQGDGHGVAVVVEQRDGAREPDGQCVRDVGARPPAQPPVDAVPVVERGRDQRRLHRNAPAPGPGGHEGLQALAGGLVLLMIVGTEDEAHRITTPDGAASGTPGSPGRERHDVRGRARVGRPTSRGPRRAAPGRRRGCAVPFRVGVPRGGRSAVRARRGSRR